MTQILDLSDKWLQHPELYYPEPKTIINCIKWHIAVSDKASKIFREANKDAYSMDIPSVSDFKRSPEADALYKRDREYFETLGYQNIALIESAMMLGRELWYKNRNSHSDYDKEIRRIGILDLHAWLDVFDIPPTIADGRNLKMAIEYTLSKNTEFLQAYIDAYEKPQRGESK